MSNLNKIKLKQIDADFSNILLKKTDSYVVAKAGDDLMLKYAEAAALTPNNSARTNRNRATLILFPGEYPTSGEPVFDIDFVDVIALGSSEKIPSVFIEDSSIRVTASNIRVVGISTKVQPFNISGGEFQVFENCVGGDNSFGFSYGSSEAFLEGTYINCTAGDNSFGFSDGSSNLFLEGTYINCTAGDNSFGYMTGGNDIRIDGNFTSCTAGNNSFGYTGGGGTLEISGNFTNCTAGNNSFGYYGWIFISAALTNCTGGDRSFSYGSVAGGTFTNCTGGDQSFASGSDAGGKFTNCTGGDQSFASEGVASGTFSSCVGGDVSFGGGGALTGSLFYCRLINGGVYESPTGPGIIRLCLQSDGEIINAPI